MKLFSKIKPLHCSAATIIKFMNECAAMGAPEFELAIQYAGKAHKVGVTSDFREGKKCFDTQFFIDRQKFDSAGAFAVGATIDGKKFAYVRDLIVLRDRDVGDPRENLLLAENEIVS